MHLKQGEYHMKKISIFKKLSIMSVLLILSVSLSACKSASSSDSGTETDTIVTEKSEATKGDNSKIENKETGEQEDTGTRIVSTPNGDIEVPEHPERIAVQYITGDVIELGVIPVGISEVYEGAAYSELVTESKNLGHHAEWDPESLMELEPDLILVIVQEDVEKFSKIAPTVCIAYDELSMEERISLIGDLLNKKDEAANAINEYYANLENAKKKLAEAGFQDYTISIFEGGLSNMTVMGDKFGTGGIAYKSLGLKAPEKVQSDIIEKEGFRESVSFEVLTEFAGDFIIRNSYEGMDDLTQNEIWKSIPAIKNNRLINMEFGLSFYTDIYSANAQIIFITEALINAANQ